MAECTVVKSSVVVPFNATMTTRWNTNNSAIGQAAVLKTLMLREPYEDFVSNGNASAAGERLGDFTMCSLRGTYYGVAQKHGAVSVRDYAFKRQAQRLCISRFLILRVDQRLGNRGRKMRVQG